MFLRQHQRSKDGGPVEGSLNAATFVAAGSRIAAPDSGAVKVRNVSIRADSYTNILELANARSKLDFAIAYAATEITSSEEQDIVMAVGVDDAAKEHLYCARRKYGQWLLYSLMSLGERKTSLQNSCLLQRTHY